MWKADVESQAIDIIENEIKRGETIYSAYCTVSKLLRIPIYKCNNRYYTKWRFILSDEIKNIIDSRKTDKQKAMVKRMAQQ